MRGNSSITVKMPTCCSSLCNVSLVGALTTCACLVPTCACVQGSLPVEITRWVSLVSLDLSFNQLTQVTAPVICSLAGLTQLRVSHNILTGTVPSGAVVPQ